MERETMVDAVKRRATRSFMFVRSFALVMSLGIAAAFAAEREGITDASTAIVVMPLHAAFAVQGDDGKTHVEYDLLVTNAFGSPVTLTTIKVTDASGTELMRLDGARLAAATQTLFDQKPVAAIPASGSVVVEIDLILPPGKLPDRLLHRIAYDFPSGDPSAPIIESNEVVGPEVTVDPRAPIPIVSPVTGPGWAAFNGCCTPNRHRDTRLAASTYIATPETFDIDWIQLDGDKYFVREGRENADYPYFGAEIRAVADGEVVDIRDDMEESVPLQRPTTVRAARDYSGNFVTMRIRPDVYAQYAHLRRGSVTVKIGDRVKAGDIIGRLGNSGHSTAPHLHFGLSDRPDSLTGASLPFVIDRFELTGTFTGDEDNLKVTPVSRSVTSAYPLVQGIATYGTAGAKKAAAASFESGACPKTTEPVPALANARCGTLIVPENRIAPNGRTIRLPVAIIPALSEDKARDPIIYMEGGPGGPALPTAELLVAAKLNRDRDVIILGQRGSRYAEPALLCPEIDGYTARRVGLAYNAPSTGRLYVEAVDQCFRRLAATGVDLGAYNTTESAADFADLRLALNIPEWNVYGVSYGTDLALTYMREHPEGVRTVTIDSVVPPHLASLGLNWTNAGTVMDRIFKGCAADPACRERYPDPAGTFVRLVGKLEAEPLKGKAVPVLLPGQPPATGAKPVDIVVDGGALATWTIGLTEALGPDLPALLDEMAQGQPEKVMASIAASASTHGGDLSWGLHNGVVCSEWVPYENPDNVMKEGRKAFPAFPDSVLAQAPQFPFMVEGCGVWPVPKAPSAQREATTGSIPTLVIAGSYDAITSQESAAAAAKPLTKATFVVIPGVGHFVVPKSPCAQAVMISFLANPDKPDTACVAKLEPPPFTVVPK